MAGSECPPRGPLSISRPRPYLGYNVVDNASVLLHILHMILTVSKTDLLKTDLLKEDALLKRAGERSGRSSQLDA